LVQNRLSVKPLAGAIGRRIAKRRETLGLSGQQLAQEAGVSIDTVRSIESGRVPNPGIMTVTKIADVLEASLDELAGRTGGEGRA
jgi:transcriptional regulator with XRE-family HTH domain